MTGARAKRRAVFHITCTPMQIRRKIQANVTHALLYGTRGNYAARCNHPTALVLLHAQYAHYSGKVMCALYVGGESFPM